MKPIEPKTKPNDSGASPNRTNGRRRMDKLRSLRDQSPRDWRALKWLTLGIGIKRWGLLALIGLILSATGLLFGLAYVAVDLSLKVAEAISNATHQLVEVEPIGWMMVVAGLILFTVGLRGTLKAVERALSPEGSGGFLDAALNRRKLEHGEYLVAIGGGTGLSTMLRGLKEYTSNITAVVTMADDGGSSGRLREEGMLPPGDLRNCMAALANAEPEMQALFQHRFEGYGPLAGHSLGNLIVAAMCEMQGDFESAVRETAKVLAIRGRVLPSTVQDVRLGARLDDGSEIIGQVAVHEAQGVQEVFLVPNSPPALPDVVRSIAEADVIVIGPGSLYTSIMPNLLVPEIREAIRQSEAVKIYVCNVMTQTHETTGFKASDHVRAIVRHAGRDMIDIALINNTHIPEDVLSRYRKVGADQVLADADAIEMMGIRAIQGNFADITNLVRHNPKKLAHAIFRIVAKL